MMAGNLYNIFSIKDGEIVQLDDMLATQPKPVPPVPPGPTPPGPTPPGPTPPGPIPPGPQVSVSISIDGNIISITATGDVSYIDGYDIMVYSGSTKVLTYREDDSSMFDMSTLSGELAIGTYTVKVQAFNDDGTVFPESNGVAWTREPDARTIWIKFRFLDSTYNPQTKQLATGKACTREDDIGTMERKKSYSADWQLLDASTNEWMWGVTSGTNVSHAFTTVKGEQSTPLLIDEDWLDAIPEEMGTLDGYTRSSCQQLVENGDWPIVPSSEFTGHANITAWDLENATDLSNMFGAIPWVSGALYGDIPGFSTKADNVSQMFSRCYHVTSLGDVDISKASQEVQVFYSMTGLTEFPELTVKSGAALTYMFGNCGNIETGIEEMFQYLDSTNPSAHGNVFRKCGILADEHALDNIPETWGGAKIVLPAMTLRFKFSHNDNPTSVTTKGTWTKVSAATGSYIWDWYCDSPDWSSAFKDAFNAYNHNVYVIAAGDTSAVTDMNRMFYGCGELISVCEFDTSNCTDCSYLFYNCSHLTSVQKIDLSNCTNVSLMFNGCYYIEDIPTLNVQKCTDLYAMFNRCGELTKISLSNTDSVTSLQGTFGGCSKLAEITGLNTENVTVMSNAFSYCKALTSIPNIDYTKVTKVGNLFAGCINITGGQYSLYNYLKNKSIAVTQFDGAFTDCGSASETGKLELDSIPTTWGGNYYIHGTVQIGNRTYKTVTLGNKEWLAENLQYEFDGCQISTDSEPISGDPGVPAAWFYGDDESSFSLDSQMQCGLLYNGYAVKYLEDNKSTLLPEGWRVPSYEDLDSLVEYVGGLDKVGLLCAEGQQIFIQNDWFPDGEWWPEANFGSSNDSYRFGYLPTGTREDFGEMEFTSLNKESCLMSCTTESGGTRMEYLRFYWGGAYPSAMYLREAGTVRLVRDVD